MMITEAYPLNPVIRLLRLSDSIAELTLLLRRAYRVLADMGFNYTATCQDEATTARRIEGGECYVMTAGAALIAPLIGTITLYRKSSESPLLAPWCQTRCCQLRTVRCRAGTSAAGIGHETHAICGAPGQ